MSVNQSAPVIAAGEIEVAADAEKVWEVMAGVEEWPSWNLDGSSLLGFWPGPAKGSALGQFISGDWKRETAARLS